MGARQVHIVLESHGHAGQRTELVQRAGGHGRVDARGGVERQLPGGLEEGVEVLVRSVDACERALGDLARAEVLGGESRADLAGADAAPISDRPLLPGWTG